MDPFLIVTLPLALFGGLASYLQVRDWYTSKKIAKLQEFPKKIFASLRFSSYQQGLVRLKQLLEDQRDPPEIVVGVHYGGISSAADIARQFYIPVRLMVTKFERQSNHTKCLSVNPSYDASEVSGKRVLLVDNRIWTGGTLAMAKKKLEEQGAASVRTLVVFQPKSATGNADIVMFKGSRDLKYVFR